MLKEERHQLILNKLTKNRKVLSVNLSRELAVSEDTIRRDLKELEAKNLLYKVHGGALLNENRLKTYYERSHSDTEEKKSIARKAVQLIHNDQVIIMSGSSTNVQIAKLIPPDVNVTIFTYSLPVALELTNHPLIEVILIGGKLNKSAQVSTGIDVINFLSGMRVDLCFMGIAGLSTNRGLTESDWEVTHIKRAMIEVSDYVVVTCTGNTLQKNERYAVVPIKKIDALITEYPSDNKIFNSFKEKGIVVL